MNPKPDIQEPNIAGHLKRAEAIKTEMTQLLTELEQAAVTAQAKLTPAPSKPGGWRHHPTEWAVQNLPPKKPQNLT
jgi:hypothetical protein